MGTIGHFATVMVAGSTLGETYPNNSTFLPPSPLLPLFILIFSYDRILVICIPSLTDRVMSDEIKIHTYVCKYFETSVHPSPSLKSSSEPEHGQPRVERGGVAWRGMNVQCRRP